MNPLPSPAARADGFHGIWGLPFVDLAPLFDTTRLEEVHEEICLGLTRVATSYTGGSLKWMGVVAPHVQQDPYADSMRVIERFSRDEFAVFVSLADDPSAFDLDRQRDYTFGDETDHPLNKRQMLYLKYRYGVYFPWKVAYHLLENVWWEDKNFGAGKTFSREVRAIFPRTLEFIESLPFREIGRAVIFGLEANDHAPLHRDTVPGSKDEVEHCITICPKKNKRFYLADPEIRTRRYVDTPLYWFNDMDWHGVEPDPFFRYSIRIDGVFHPAFERDLQRFVARQLARR
jgi:Rieske 2Fe-2S family protein